MLHLENQNFVRLRISPNLVAQPTQGGHGQIQRLAVGLPRAARHVDGVLGHAGCGVSAPGRRGVVVEAG